MLFCSQSLQLDVSFLLQFCKTALFHLHLHDLNIAERHTENQNIFKQAVHVATDFMNKKSCWLVVAFLNIQIARQWLPRRDLSPPSRLPFVIREAKGFYFTAPRHISFYLFIGTKSSSDE